MPRNVDAVALVFIVVVVLVTGYFADHGPMCLADGIRIGVVNDRDIRVIGPLVPPAPPRMPAPPRLPGLPQLPILPQLPRL